MRLIRARVLAVFAVAVTSTSVFFSAAYAQQPAPTEEEWARYDSLGEALMIAGDLDGAIASYERSVELNPENANGMSPGCSI